MTDPNQPGQSGTRENGPQLASVDAKPRGEMTISRFMDRLGIKILEAHQGRSALEMVVSADHLRSLDMAHGGVIASLLDSASGLAAHSLAPLDQVTLTVQLNVNYIRPAFQGETLRAVGKILHSGRRTAVVTSELRTAAGDLVASSSATMMYVAKNQSMPKSTGRG